MLTSKTINLVNLVLSIALLSNASVFNCGKLHNLASDNLTCEALKIAVEDNDKYNIGILLGYPESATLNFTNKKPGGIHSFQQMSNECINLLHDNKKIPNFFAYLLHLPEKITVTGDLVTLDSKSEDIGKKYMKHIRSIDKNLSRENEHMFILEMFRDTRLNFNVYSNGEFYFKEELLSTVKRQN